MNKICFITAIYGNYETSCKKYVTQTIGSDFICFTDNQNIICNGWTIDTTPYHIIKKSPLDNDTYIIIHLQITFILSILLSIISKHFKIFQFSRSMTLLCG